MGTRTRGILATVVLSVGAVALTLSPLLSSRAAADTVDTPHFLVGQGTNNIRRYNFPDGVDSTKQLSKAGVSSLYIDPANVVLYAGGTQRWDGGILASFPKADPAVKPAGWGSVAWMFSEPNTGGSGGRRGNSPVNPYLRWPTGIVTDSSGMLWVADNAPAFAAGTDPGKEYDAQSATNHIVRIDPNHPLTWDQNPTGQRDTPSIIIPTTDGASNYTLSGPTRLLLGPDQNSDGTPDLYVNNSGKQSVLIFDPTDGSYIKELIAKTGPNGTGGTYTLKSLSDMVQVGNELLISSSSDKTIFTFDASTGDYLGIFATNSALTPLVSPSTMQLGPDGNLYVRTGSGATNGLAAYSLDGTYLDTVQFISGTTTNNPSIFAIYPNAQPVPEPMSAALIIQGGALVLLTTRKRRRKHA